MVEVDTRGNKGSRER